MKKLEDNIHFLLFISFYSDFDSVWFLQNAAFFPLCGGMKGRGERPSYIVLLSGEKLTIYVEACLESSSHLKYSHKILTSTFLDIL